jgi:hypothetical protein
MNEFSKDNRADDAAGVAVQRFVRRQILHLTLHRKWFDVIARGEKHEENRAQSAHWKKRLNKHDYSEIHFRNGYAKNAPMMRVECLGMTLGQWEGWPCFVFKLGKILEIKNYETAKTPNAPGEKSADAQTQSAVSHAEADGQSKIEHQA